MRKSMVPLMTVAVVVSACEMLAQEANVSRLPEGSGLAQTCPGADDFIKHAIKPARPGADGNTVPSMVWLDDVDGDGHLDLIATHVAWMSAKGYVYPYTAWYKGPGFRQEFVIVDKNSFGPKCRIYRFVMFDVDGDG